MNTFHSTETDRKRNSADGFTLIELLVVLALLAVLPTLLLPAVQKIREAAARLKSSAHVNQLIIASQEYHHRTGSYPATIDDLVGWNFTPIDPAVVQGKKNGYVFEIESDRDQCRIEAKPEFAGITGSVMIGAVVTQSGVRSYQIISAGAAEATEWMLSNIQVKASETIATLLGLDGSVTSLAREYADDNDTTEVAVNTIDRNGDGQMSIEEMLNCSSAITDAQLRRPLEEFLSYVSREMKLDILSEDEQQAIAVNISDLEQANQSALFSYSRLMLLTKACINQPEIGDSLSEKLEIAQAAEAKGDLRARNEAMEKFQEQIDSQIGRTITAADARRLTVLAAVMTSGE
jgi:prepilin-type N-terminal cleavage/methylation domain-containing protein